MILTPQKLWPSAILITLLLVLANPAWAFSLPDLLKPVEELIQQTPLAQIIPGNQQLTISSTITLAPNGDVNKNGQIDAGEAVIFTYTIQNTTDKRYTYATLKTNIPRNSLNFIHDVVGVTGLKDDGKTIDFPNLRINPGGAKVIGFSAKINYFTDKDPIISTEPELLTEDKKSIYRSSKQEIQAKRISPDKIPSTVIKKTLKESNKESSNSGEVAEKDN